MKARHPIIEQILLFLGIGVAVVLFILGLYIVSALLLWGAVVGLVIFVITFIKTRFFPSSVQSHQGRIIDHDDHA